MEPERIWILLARKLSREASGKDLEELADLIKNKPELGVYFEVITDLWKSEQQPTDGSADKVFNRIQARLKKEHIDATPVKQPAKQKDRAHQPAFIKRFFKTGRHFFCYCFATGMLGYA